MSTQPTKDGPLEVPGRSLITRPVTTMYIRLCHILRDYIVIIGLLAPWLAPSSVHMHPVTQDDYSLLHIYICRLMGNLQN